MGQTRPAPDTSPLPEAASIAEFSAVETRRLEAERRSGVIFETSRPGKLLIDGQAPVVDPIDNKPVEAEKAPEKQPESVPSESGDHDRQDESVEEAPEPSESHD